MDSFDDLVFPNLDFQFDWEEKYVIQAVSTEISKLREDIYKKLSKKKFYNKWLYLVALDEAITNIAEHGLNFNKNSKVFVKIQVKHPKILTLIKDYALPFDLSQEKKFLPQKQFRLGGHEGYGIRIIKRVFEKIEYNSNNGENITSLFFDDTKI